jgi:hypothetical protein
VQRQPEISPHVTSSKMVKGEAVIVDLGERGVLFALLGEDYAYNVVFKAFPRHGATTPEGIEYYSNLKDARATLEPGPLPDPMLVMFTDISDPLTVRLVDQDDLAASFGEGVSLKEITIEMTEDPLAWRIDEYLPWLSGLGGSYLHGGSTSRNAPLGGLHTGYFKRGDK